MPESDPTFWARTFALEHGRRLAAAHDGGSPMNLITHQVVVEALKHRGVVEVGNNDGPEVRAWLARVFRKPGAPWCAAFAWCCLDDACRELGLSNPIPATAGVHLLAQRARIAGGWTAEPGPGFVGLHDAGKSKAGARLGHCGIILEVGEHHCLGIEGNTDEAGSREGQGVHEKPRALAYWDLGYLDPGLLFQGEPVQP